MIETSRLNHPGHEFLCQSIQDVRPNTVFKAGKARFGWGSPSCKTHSSAKGGVPVDKEDRVGPDEILEWMKATDTDHVIVENVPEFVQYTYLVPVKDKTGAYVFQHRVNGKRKLTSRPPIPQGSQSFEDWCKALSGLGYEVCLTQDKTRLGELFRKWLDDARALGYEADYRVLVAADYGDATTRKRLFVQFAKTSAGVRVVWPKPTHCKPDRQGRVPPGMKRWRTARDILDTSDLGTSIFDRKRPLAPKTLRRILIGLEKFVIKPLLQQGIPDDKFILPQQRGGAQVKSVDIPVSPITCKGAEAVCSVRTTTNVLKYYGTATAVSVDAPLDTVTTKSRFGLQTTFVSTIDNRSNRDGTTPVDAPISTITTKQRHAAVSCMIQTAYTGSDASRVGSLDQPVKTVAGNRGDGAIVTYDIPETHGGGQVVLELNGLAPGGKGRPVLRVGNQVSEIDIMFRMFTVRELAAAQGLPEDYKFAGTKTDAIAGIGNGVPVNLVRALTAAAVSQQEDIIQQLAISPYSGNN